MANSHKKKNTWPLIWWLHIMISKAYPIIFLIEVVGPNYNAVDLPYCFWKPQQIQLLWGCLFEKDLASCYNQETEDICITIRIWIFSDGQKPSEKKPKPPGKCFAAATRQAIALRHNSTGKLDLPDGDPLVNLFVTAIPVKWLSRKFVGVRFAIWFS